MKQVPILDLKRQYEYMKADIDPAIKRCLEHQRWIFGPEVNELEDRIADYIGVEHCIGTSSGTDALVLSLRALAIKLKGQEYFDSTDEIITTPFTFTATGDAILRAGATPVFLDIDPQTYNINPEHIQKYLAENASNVVGILPVHLYGQACNMDEIDGMAKEHGLFVLEDVAQAFGGMWKERRLGSLGTASAFSFFPTKNLGGFGDGGMVATNNGEIAELARMLLKHGGKDKYDVDHIGYNARLDTVQAAVLLIKLNYFDDFSERRRRIAEFYSEGLKDIQTVVLPTSLPDADHAYHQYTIRVPAEKRDSLQKHLRDRGITTMIYYPTPLDKMKVFEGRKRVPDSSNESQKAAKEVLSLPIEPLLEKEELEIVVNEIKKALL